MKHLSFDESRFVGVVPCQIVGIEPDLVLSAEADRCMENEWFCGNLLCRRRLSLRKRILRRLGKDVGDLEYGIVYCGTFRAKSFACGTLAEYFSPGMAVRGMYVDGSPRPRFLITQVSSLSQVGNTREWSRDEINSWIGELTLIQPELCGMLDVVDGMM